MLVAHGQIELSIAGHSDQDQCTAVRYRSVRGRRQLLKRGSHDYCHRESIVYTKFRIAQLAPVQGRERIVLALGVAIACPWLLFLSLDWPLTPLTWGNW